LRFAVETREDCQILQFFSASTKRCIVGPLVYTETRESEKREEYRFFKKVVFKTVGLSNGSIFALVFKNRN
jgi:hypothetical protein